MADDAIMVTTETERGRHELRAASLMVRLSGAFVVAAALFIGFAPDAWTSQPSSLFERILFGLMTGALGVALLGAKFIVRGSWRLDDDGIRFSPLRGSPRSMAWHEIEAIAPGDRTNSFAFRAGRLKLPLDLRWETPERKAAAIDFFRAKLGAYFDIFDRRPAKTSLRRILWASAIASAVILLCMGGAILSMLYLPEAQWRIWAPVLVFLPFLSCCVWALVILWRGLPKRWSCRIPQLPSRE